MTLIRTATPADIPAMMALAAEADSAAHWRQQEYLRLFDADAPPRLALLLESGQGQLCGFLVALCAGPEWEIENVVVSASGRRAGLGSQLLAEFLRLAQAAGAKSVFLEVRESNQPACALYEKWGFAQSGRRKRYYSQPAEDALLYRCVLRAAEGTERPQSTDTAAPKNKD